MTLQNVLDFPEKVRGRNNDVSPHGNIPLEDLFYVFIEIELKRNITKISQSSVKITDLKCLALFQYTKCN